MVESNTRQKLINRMGVPVATHEVKARNINTAYLEAGSGTPLVLLHGAGAGSVVWYQTIGALSNHFRVIVPDVVGYGESDKPSAAYDRPFYVSWLHDFLDAIELDRISLAGVSQGGAIAAQFAIDYPDRVNHLALIDSGALGEDVSKRAIFYTFLMNAYPTKIVRRQLTKYLVHEKSSINDLLSQYSMEVIQKPGATRPFWDGQGEAVSAIPDEELQSLSMKTDIIWGEEDRFIPLAHGKRAKELIPDAALHTIEEAGHFPFLDRPLKFNEQIIDFFTTE
jgi:4,5:9,10-diseco-3-hydroxy-5,9,17-trioxoandrosta-1(10),2-diene-4-oate hydrolase